MDDLTFEPLDDNISLKEDTMPENQNNKMSSIKKVFEAANDNVKAATQIFDRCVAMQNKINREKQEIVLLREEHANRCKQEIAHIKKYKDDIFRVLKEKKAELDKEADNLKQRELELANGINRLEMEKKRAFEKLREREEKQKEGLLEKNKELDRRKVELDEERRQLDFDKAKADQTAKELEENLKKFNDVVSQFTSGIDGLM